MLRCQNDTTLHLGLRQAWQHTCKVNDEVGTGMGDDSEVSILTLSHLLRQLYLQLFLIVIILTHS